MKVKSKVNVLPHQKLYAENRDPFIGIVAGYGSGKSDADVFRTFSLARYRNKLGQKISLVLTAPTYRILKDANIPDYMEFLEKYKIRNIYRDNDKKVILQAKELEGEIWFRSADKPENIVGFDATDAILDEFDIQKPAKQKDVWTKINGRMRGCQNATLAISTTAEGFRYTYQLFHEDNIGKLINARTYHNTFLPETYIWNNLFKQYGNNVPNVKPEDLSWDECYLEYYTPLLGQYVGGEFVNVNGLAAYYAFHRDKCVLDIEDYRPHTREIYIGIDFNVNPLCFTVGEIIAGQLIIFEEYHLNNSNTFEAAEKIAEKYAEYFIRIYPDMTGANRKTSATISDIQILRKIPNSQIIGTSNPRVRDRLNAVNNAINTDKVKITKNCRHLINDLEKVVTDSYGDIDKSDAELTHMSDAFGYKICKLFPIKTGNRNIIRSA